MPPPGAWSPVAVRAGLVRIAGWVECFEAAVGEGAVGSGPPQIDPAEPGYVNDRARAIWKHPARFRSSVKDHEHPAVSDINADAVIDRHQMIIAKLPNDLAFAAWFRA